MIVPTNAKSICSRDSLAHDPEKKKQSCSFIVGEDREGFILVNERVHHESRPHSVDGGYQQPLPWQGCLQSPNDNPMKTQEAV